MTVIREGNSSSKPRYSHSPFTLEHNGVTVECDKDGKIRLTQNNIDDDDGQPVTDEITTSAALFNRVMLMLRGSRKVTFNTDK